MVVVFVVQYIRASGPELLEYCKQNFKDNMVNGEVRITSGFHLNMILYIS